MTSFDALVDGWIAHELAEVPNAPRNSASTVTTNYSGTTARQRTEDTLS